MRQVLKTGKDFHRWLTVFFNGDVMGQKLIVVMILTTLSGTIPLARTLVASEENGRASRSPQGQPGNGPWIIIKPGETQHDFTLKLDGSILFRNMMIHRWNFKENGADLQPSLHITAPNRQSNQIAVLRWDEDWGAMGGWLIDATAGKITASRISPDRWRLVQWVSWSPDGRFALFAASGEITMGDMSVVDSHSGQMQTIRYQDLTNDHGHKQVQTVDLANLTWSSATRYRVAVQVKCNLFELPGCNADRVVSSRTVEVDVPSLAAHYVR